MFIFPSHESKTNFKFPPWISIFLAFISLVGYLVFHLPTLSKAAQAQEKARQMIDKTLDRQHQAGELDRTWWIKAKETPEVIGEPENRQIFDEEVRHSWREYAYQSKPLEQLGEHSINKLAYIITPHHPLLLLLGMGCLWIIGYLFEHQYDRQVVLALFITSGCSWVILEPYIPAPFWPPALFAWAHTVGVVLLVGWLTAPTAVITVTLRPFWKSGGFDINLPAFFIPALFLTGHGLITWFASEYSASFSPYAFGVIATQAVVFSLTLLLVPARPLEPPLTTEQEIGRGIARAERDFEEKRSEEGAAEIRKIMTMEPKVNQMRLLAELAWRNERIELADQIHRVMLRKALNSGNQYLFVDIACEILFRNMPISAEYLKKAMALAIQDRRFEITHKLLPYLRDHTEISNEEQSPLMERLAEMLLAQKTPDRQYLLLIQQWLEAHNQGAPVFAELSAMFGKAGSNSSNLSGFYRPATHIHRTVNVDLIAVESNQIKIQVSGQKVQHVPWTAVIGACGCHISEGQRGYRGAVVVRFKRKIFACIFSTSHILIKEDDQPMTFERAWTLMKTNIPEDMPFMDLPKFPSLKKEAELDELIETFLNEPQVEVPPS